MRTCVELAHVQRVVTAEAAGIDNAVRSDFPLDDRHQCGYAEIVYQLGVHPAAALEDAEYGHFAGSTTTPLALAHVTKVALVQFATTPSKTSCSTRANSVAMSTRNLR